MIIFMGIFFISLVLFFRSICYEKIILIKFRKKKYNIFIGDDVYYFEDFEEFLLIIQKMCGSLLIIKDYLDL